MHLSSCDLSAFICRYVLSYHCVRRIDSFFRFKSIISNYFEFEYRISFFSSGTRQEVELWAVCLYHEVWCLEISGDCFTNNTAFIREFRGADYTRELNVTAISLTSE